MSHTYTTEVKIKSITALTSTVERLNSMGIKASLITDAVPRLYYQDQMTRYRTDANSKKEGIVFRDDNKADYVLRVEGCNYDVGFLKNQDGDLVPLFDSYNRGGGLFQHLGDNLDKLMREYTRCATLEVAHYNGYSLVNEEEKDGEYVLQFASY